MAKTRPQSDGTPTQRQLRVAEVIRRAPADVFARGDIHDPDLAHVSITVSEVRCSTDLRHATVFVLPLGGINTDAVIKALNQNKAEVRHQVTGHIDLKYSPQFSFQPDRSFDQMDRTRALLDSEEVRRDLKDDQDED